MIAFALGVLAGFGAAVIVWLALPNLPPRPREHKPVRYSAISSRGAISTGNADRMPGEWTGAAFPYGHPLRGNE